jgi:hypothetical protein
MGKRGRKIKNREERERREVTASKFGVHLAGAALRATKRCLAVRQIVDSRGTGP